MTRGIQKVTTAIGDFYLEWDGACLQRVGLPGQILAGDPVRGDASAAKLLQRYASGGEVDPAQLPLQLADTELTPFQRRVLQALRKVRRGKTVTYAQLAARAGSPQAARAVGQVMRMNPWPLIVPCHRVLASGGGLGGYSGPRGTKFKQQLLGIEGVVVQAPGAC